MAAVPTHIDWTNLMLHDTKQKRLRLPMLSINTSFTQVLEDGAAKLTRSSFFTEETLETALEQVRNRQLILSAAVTEISDALADLQTRFTEMVRVSTLLTRIRALPVVPLPDLPLDILRTILEIHAGTSPRNASNLSVVSPQVQQWTDPALFRTIILREESYGQRDAFVDMFAGQTPLSKRVSQGLEMTRVVHLTSPLPLPVVERFINLCPAIYQLSIHGAKLGPLLILNQPHLRHMACNLQYFVSSVAPTPDISASQLHNLESFKITTKYSVWSQWDLTTLRRLPRLRYIEVFASRPENADILRGVLQGRLIPSFPSTLELAVVIVPRNWDPLTFTDIREGSFHPLIVCAMSLSSGESNLLPEGSEWVVPIVNSKVKQEWCEDVTETEGVQARARRVLKAREVDM